MSGVGVKSATEKKAPAPVPETNDQLLRQLIRRVAALEGLLSALAGVEISDFAATLLDDSDEATARTTLGAVNIAGDTMTGTLVAPIFRSGATNGGIADDAVADFGDVAPQASLILIWSTTLSGPLRVTAVHARTQSPSVTYKFGDSTNITFTTSNVTGTSGIDGNITVSFTAGHMKIENRSGGSVGFGYAVLSALTI